MDYEGRLQREKISEEKSRERRKVVAAMGGQKRRKITTRIRDCEISEKVALGIGFYIKRCRGHDI